MKRKMLFSNEQLNNTETIASYNYKKIPITFVLTIEKSAKFSKKKRK